MAAINIKAFRGQVPRVSDRLLQGNQATRAMNCKITSGRLDPLNGLGATFTAAVAIKTVYRYRHFLDGQAIDNWLTWASDVDVVPSPLANDEQGKFYFTSADFEPRMATYAIAVQSAPLPSAWYALGVPSPTVKPTIGVTGGAAPTESRGYAYTFVTAFGEESGPSPAELATGNIDGTWNLSNLQTAPPNSGSVTAATFLPAQGRVRVTLNTVFGLAQYDTIAISGVVGMTDLNATHRILAVDVANSRIEVALLTAQSYTSGGSWARNAPLNTTGMTKRIYRSAGSTGSFLFVDEIPVAQTTYADTKSGTALGETLPTLNTVPPPKNLTCLISLPNGCLVGLAGNELCFSDPYMPYSWPIGNRYSFSGHGVALCKSGNSVIVLTDTFPILFTGSDPEAMSPAVMETYAPCVSKRGTVDVGGGCLYPSFDGLWIAAPGRVENLTRRLYREKEWSSLVPSSFVAAFHDGQYYGHYRSDHAEPGRILVIDINEPDSVVEVDDSVDTLYRNEYDGRLYVAQGTRLSQWDASEGQRYDSDWVSATLQLPRPTNFAVAQVHAAFDQVVPLDTVQLQANEDLISSGADAVAGHLNGHELLAFEINASYIVPVVQDKLRNVQFTLYRDGEPVFTKGVTSSTPFRLPAGYRAEVFNIGLRASVPAYSVAIAESTAELAQQP
jgi:hypothetical protein